MVLSRQIALGMAILIWLLALLLLSPILSLLLGPILVVFVDYLPRGPVMVFAIAVLLLCYIEARLLGIWLRLPFLQVLVWVLLAELVLQPVHGWLIGFPDYMLLSGSPYWHVEYGQNGFAAGWLALDTPWLWLAAGAIAVAVKAPFYYLALVRRQRRALWPAIAAPAVSYAFLVALNWFTAMANGFI